MHRRAVDPDGARPAIARVATLFDAEDPTIAQKRCAGIDPAAARPKTLWYRRRSSCARSRCGQFGADLLGEMVGQMAFVVRGAMHIVEIAIRWNARVDCGAQRLRAW